MGNPTAIGQIISKIEVGAQLTQTSTSQSLQRCKKEEIESFPEWMPKSYEDEYYSTDLTYTYFLDKCMKLQAAKRDTVPPETMRVWFVEFLRRGWTQRIFDLRYNAIMSEKMFGAVTIDNWLNANEMLSREEVNIEVDRIIEKKIREAEFMKEQGVKLTEQQERYIKYAAAQKFIKGCEIERYRTLEEKIEEEQERLKQLLNVKKMRIMNLTQIQKMTLLEKCLERGEIHCDRKGLGYAATLSCLEMYADKISDSTFDEFMRTI